MKLHLMSDLHLDHWSGEPFRPTCDDEANTVLVLAGDIIGLTTRNFRPAVDFFSDVVSRYQEVVYVTGNHEYYGTSWVPAHQQILDLEAHVVASSHSQKSLIVAEDFKAVSLKEQRLLCGTMWIPEPGRGTPDITDNQLIRRYKPEVFRRHKTFCDYLQTMLQPTDVVVTHHMPSAQSIAAEYYGSIYNAWFCAPEVEKLIREKQPKLWIHGHTHVPFRYRIGSTQVVCNPRGYPGENCVGEGGLKFDPHLVVEI